MKRRAFITGLGAAAAWPLCASAQQPEKMRRIGAIMPLVEGDPEFSARKRVLEQTLAELGWTTGRNIEIEYRSATSNTERSRHAAELAALAPDVRLDGQCPASPFWRPNMTHRTARRRPPRTFSNARPKGPPLAAFVVFGGY